MAATWTWPPDKWERLSTVAALCGAHASVADIGGRRHELARLLPGSRVTTVNVEPPCDVLVSPGRLPLEDDSFDAVVSTDVLEHVPGDERALFLSELVRIARTRVVVCFPCGSPAKDAAERLLADALRERFGVRMDWLEEHLELGLPRPADVDEMLTRAIDELAPGAVRRWSFSAGVEESDDVLLSAMAARHHGDLRAGLRVLRAWVDRSAPALRPTPGDDGSRAYLVVEIPSGSATSRDSLPG